MAAEVSSTPVNGYAPHQGYGGLEQQYSNPFHGNANMPAQNAYNAPAAPSTASTSSAAQTAAPSKDEVGWYFVEQYYTTLSRNPEKVYLFYSKRSQFVSGQETDKVQVCVGQRAINDRIKELEFQDTKVRVTNVDSQASDSNIVIQVIGEISNKSQPHRKFVQTFILATQTNGYFVLNDIFRYLIDEEDEPEQEAAPAAQQEEPQQAPAAESGYQEPAPTAEESEPKTLTSSNDPVEVESDAQKVDKMVESRVLGEPNGAASSTREEPVEEAPAPEPEAAEAAAEPTSTEAAPTEISKTDTKEADLQAEKPAAPEPTPAASPPKQAPAQPAPASKPAAPPVPKTWASLAASANKTSTPAAPSSNASSQASQQPRTASAPKAAPAPPPSVPAAQPTPSAPAAQRVESPAANSQDEWTAVGSSHNRQQSRQVNQQQQQRGPETRGYIPRVYEGVPEAELRSHMEKFGELKDFDLSRQKNCVWLEWKTPEGFNAAVAANPHNISDHALKVEQRRPRPGEGSYGPRGGAQGAGRGRGGFQGGRGGPQGQGRGSFQGPRGGRGGGPAPRGGSTSQHI